MKVPISDSGIAITGISTERGEPRNTKTTSVTMSTAIDQRAHHFVDGAADELGRVVDDLAVQSLRQLRLDPGKTARTPWITSSRLAAGATWMPI